MSVYKIAIDETTRTIDKRAKYFRNLIVMVVIVSLASAGWAVISMSVIPLAGFLLLIPMCGIFFFLDCKLLEHWQSKLFATWTIRELQFSALCDAVSAIPVLPKNTLQAMLATLPAVADMVAEQKISISTREAVATVAITLQRYSCDKLAFKTAQYGLVALCLMLAVMLRMWQPAVGLLMLVAFPLLKKWTWQRRLSVLRKGMRMLREQPDFDASKHEELVSMLQWGLLPDRERNRMLGRH